MKSITIHNLETDLAIAVEKLSKTTGLSQNKVIKKLLREALNISERGKPKRDISFMLGMWSDEEAKIFDEAIKEFAQIDEELWK